MDRLIWFDRWGSYLGEIKQDMLLDATRKIELNGEDSITLTTTQPIAKGNRILWQDGQGYWHEFVVSSIEETHDNSGEPVSVVWCESSLCELRGDYIVNKRPGVSSGGVLESVALEQALDGTRWTAGTCEPTALSGASLYHVSVFDALSTIIETWGGEIDPYITVDESTGVSARTLNIRSHRGKTLQQITRRFEWSRDITSIKRTVDETDVITGCYAWGKGEEIIGEDGPTGGYGRRIGIASVNPTGKDYIVDDVANAIFGRGDGGYVFGEYLDENCEDPQKLYEGAVKYLDENKVPHISYEASVSQYYEAGLDLTGVNVGDEVQVVDNGYTPALRVVARVMSMEWSLLDPTTMQVTIGNFTGNIADIVLSTNRRVTSLDDKSAVYDAVASGSTNYMKIVQDAMNSVFASSGTFVSFDFNRGIVVMNNENEQQATWIMELSSAGWRIANTKDSSGNWQWTTMATGAGIVANSITSGTIDASLINTSTLRAKYVGNSVNQYAELGAVQGQYVAAETGLVVHNDESSNTSTSWGMASNQNGLYQFYKNNGENYFSPIIQMMGGEMIFTTPDIANSGVVLSMVMDGSHVMFQRYDPNDQTTPINQTIIPYGITWTESGVINVGRVSANASYYGSYQFKTNAPGSPMVFLTSNSAHIAVGAASITSSQFMVHAVSVDDVTVNTLQIAYFAFYKQ